MSSGRTIEDVRREIEVERRELARALERLRAETTGVKRAMWRRAKVALLLLVFVTAVVAAVRMALRRID